MQPYFVSIITRVNSVPFIPHHAPDAHGGRGIVILLCATIQSLNQDLKHALTVQPALFTHDDNDATEKRKHNWRHVLKYNLLYWSQWNNHLVSVFLPPENSKNGKLDAGSGNWLIVVVDLVFPDPRVSFKYNFRLFRPFGTVNFDNQSSKWHFGPPKGRSYHFRSVC